MLTSENRIVDIKGGGVFEYDIIIGSCKLSWHVPKIATMVL